MAISLAFWKRSGWLRLWILMTVIWTIVILSIQYRNFPDESEVRMAYRLQDYDHFGLADKIKEVELQCEKKSQEAQKRDDSYNLYLECLNANNFDGKKSNLEMSRKNHFQKEDQVTKEEMTRSYSVYAAKTLSFWLIPIFSVLILGFGIQWVVRGFSV